MSNWSPRTLWILGVALAVVLAVAAVGSFMIGLNMESVARWGFFAGWLILIISANAVAAWAAANRRGMQGGNDHP